MIDKLEDILNFDSLIDLTDRRHFLNEHAIIVVTDTSGTITSVNNKFVEISGYSQQELIGKNHRLINSGYHEPAFFRELWSTISNGDTWKGEIQNKAKDGTYYWVQSTIVPIKNKQGVIIRYIALRTDVTREKKMAAALNSVQKHEAIGRVTASIAHDFNNLLGIIIGSFEILEKYVIDDDTAKTCINAGLSSSKRAAAIVHKLTRHSKEFTSNTEYYPFHKAVSDYIRFLMSSRLTNIHTTTDYATDLVEVQFNKKNLEESLYELACNAKEALGADGVIDFSTHNLSLDEQTTWSTITLEPGQYVMFEIADDGVGVCSDISNEIFDPFFTTKEFGLGKGLGLANVQTFVRHHNGQLGFTSTQNTRTVFRLYLPISQNNL